MCQITFSERFTLKESCNQAINRSKDLKSSEIKQLGSLDQGNNKPASIVQIQSPNNDPWN